MVLLEDLSLYRNGVPHDVYDRLRAEPGLYHNRGGNPFYAILTHAEATAVLQDTRTYSSAAQGILIEDVSAEMRPVMRAMLPFCDPPDHTQLRGKLSGPLTPARLSHFKSGLESACGQLVDQALAQRDIDFVQMLAAEVPLLAFGLLMGLERADIEPLRAPSDSVIQNGINRSGDAVAELCRCLEGLVVTRIQAPRDDYMTCLAQVELTDRPLSRMERNGLLLQIVIGGLETTRSAIAGLLVALDQDRTQWDALRAAPRLLANAVEESLRYVSPINYLRRTATVETSLRGTMLRPGTRVVVFLGAANRDPGRFARPHELDLARSNARQHVALGSGAHFCMGAALARMQLTAFWGAFTARVADFELRGAYERGGVVQQNFIRRLPVRLLAAA